MNERTFLKEFAESIDRDRMTELVFNEMISYCNQNDITLDEMSNEQLEQLAEAFVDRGLTFDGDDGDKWEVGHGLKHTLGFERFSGTRDNPGNTYRFKVRDGGDWRTIDAHPGMKVKYLQNRL